MTTHDLQALQLPQGGFPSTVTMRAGQVTDCNGFTTAMVLRAIRHVPDDEAMAGLRHAALRHLLTCASPHVPGAFAFWPDTARPDWARSVPADVDDTALIVTELVRHRWLIPSEALWHCCHAIVPNRVVDLDALPPWVAPGCFYTWIAPAPTSGAANVVDCCVNANVAALMTLLKATHLPGYEAAVATVRHGIAWAGQDATKLSMLTPFYPSVHSLIDALDHAIECGVDAFREPVEMLRTAAPVRIATDEAYCRSAYGSTVWRSHALDIARALAHQQFSR